MLPSVIGLPDGCFALTMPGAYRPALAGAIFKGEHPKRRGERVGGPGSTAGGASVRRGQRVFLSAPSSLASAAKVQHPAPNQHRVERRAVLRGASERYLGPTRWPPLSRNRRLLYRPALPRAIFKSALARRP